MSVSSVCDVKLLVLEVRAGIGYGYICINRFLLMHRFINSTLMIGNKLLAGPEIRIKNI